MHRHSTKKKAKKSTIWESNIRGEDFIIISWTLSPLQYLLFFYSLFFLSCTLSPFFITDLYHDISCFNGALFLPLSSSISEPSIHSFFYAFLSTFYFYTFYLTTCHSLLLCVRLSFFFPSIFTFFFNILFIVSSSALLLCSPIHLFVPLCTPPIFFTMLWFLSYFS